jgi:hypothetical protein
MNAKELGKCQAYPSPMGDMGLTKRELIAAMAMQALLGKNMTLHDVGGVGDAALKFADQLLAELAKDGGEE